MLGLKVHFSRILIFLLVCELRAYTYGLLGRFKHILHWFETKFVALTHLIEMLGLEVLFFTLFEIFLGCELRTYA